MDLDDFREQFPVLTDRTHLFAGMVAPLATPVLQELQAWQERWRTDPVGGFDQYVADAARLRRSFAGLIGAQEHEIAVLGNTSEGSNRVIGMLAARSRPVVLVDDTTFPTMIYPWLTKTTKRVEYAPPEKLADSGWLAGRLERGDVLAVAVSHVGNLNGFRHDLERLSSATRPNEVLLLVDAAQSAGVTPIDVERMGVDVLTTTALKWLLGTPGVGLMYMRRSLREQLALADCGYLQAQVDGDTWPRTNVPEFPPTVASLEIGIPAIGCLAASAMGIELLLATGVEAIAARVEKLMDELLPALDVRGFELRTPPDATRRAGVVAATYPHAAELYEFLRQRRIDIGGFAHGLVRIDPHGYNTADDIAGLLDAIDEFAGAQRGADL